MIIKITYIGTLNGVHGVWCGFKPEGAVIKKEVPVLYPDENKKLKKIGEEELFDFVVLKDYYEQEEYEEIEPLEEDEEKEKDAD